MSTTSTIPTIKTQLVSLFTTALNTSSTDGGPVQVGYAWPGPDTQPESVFLGKHPALSDPTNGLPQTSELAAIKAGRKSRQETYTVDFTVWCFRPELTAADAATAETRGFALLAPLEDVLANDPRIGLAAGVLVKASVAGVNAALVPFETGWASYIVVSIDVDARLT